MSGPSTLAGSVSARATAERAALGNATCDAHARHDLYHRGFAISAASFVVQTLPSRLSAITHGGNVLPLLESDDLDLIGNPAASVAGHDLSSPAWSELRTATSDRNDASFSAPCTLTCLQAWRTFINLLGEIGVYFGFHPTAVTVLRRDTSDINRRSVRLHLRILSRRRHRRAKPDQQSNVKRLLYYVGALALLYISVPLRMALFIGWPILCTTTRTARDTLFMLAYTIVTALHLSMALLARTVLLCIVIASITIAGAFAVAVTALDALIRCLCFIWTPYSTSQKWFARVSVSAIDLFRRAIGGLDTLAHAPVAS
jgi:hypothetical protein